MVRIKIRGVFLQSGIRMMVLPPKIILGGAGVNTRGILSEQKPYPKEIPPSGYLRSSDSVHAFLGSQESIFSLQYHMSDPQVPLEPFNCLGDLTGKSRPVPDFGGKPITQGLSLLLGLFPGRPPVSLESTFHHLDPIINEVLVHVQELRKQRGEVEIVIQTEYIPVELHVASVGQLNLKAAAEWKPLDQLFPSAFELENARMEMCGGLHGVLATCKPLPGSDKL